MEAHTRLLGGDTMKYLLLVLALFLVSCGASNTEPAPVVRQQPGKELCAAACGRMTQLTCEEALPIPASPEMVACDGGTCMELVECDADAGNKTCVSCEAFCAYQHDNGVFWDTPCMANITTCEEVESVCNTQ